jgi:ADP-heptose:LPS heptosyltransferase
MKAPSLKEWAVVLRDVGLIAVDALLQAPVGGRAEQGEAFREEDGDRRSVLALRLDAIGDFVVWLDAAEGLRDYYADAEITLVGNALWTGLAERVSHFDRVVPVDPYRFRHQLRYRRSILQKLTQTHYREALHVVHRRSGRFADAEAIMRAISADRKIVSQGDPTGGWRERWSRRWYTDVLPVAEDAMELRRNAEFVRELGHRRFQSGLPTLSPSTLPPVDDFPDTYYVFFPGAGADHRRWPSDRFAEIADRIEQQTGWPGVVCGGPGEEALGTQICEAADASLQNWIGQTTLPELASVIAGANLLLGNETSAVHLATAVGTPSVCILGGGHYGRFLPYDVEHNPSGRPVPKPVIHDMPCFGCDWNCCFDVPDGAPTPCVDRIATDAVWNCVQDVLAETEAAKTSGSMPRASGASTGSD